MKPGFLLLVFSCCSFLLKAQADLAGSWKGKIAAFDLTLVFNITEKDKKLKATMDSPDQGSKDIPCDQVVVNGDAIMISVSIIGGNFTGTLSADKKTIEGKWNQGGGSFDLILGRDGIPEAKAKPQTPKPPFGYRAEEVEYDNSGKTVHLAGTLTYPSGGTNFPAAILISGSGQQDRDETLMGHKPFAVIADRLTKLGFAVLRVDDRGMGKSTGETSKATSADFAKDVITSINYLKSRKDIDPGKIGLIGHSEGGLIAAIVAAERNDISFMVLLAGPGIKGADLLEEQGEKVILASGLSTEAVAAYKPLYRKLIDLSASGIDSAGFAIKARQEFHAWKSKTDPSMVKQVGFTDMANTEAILENLIQSFTAPWMQFFLASDAAPLLEKTSAKVLALNGEKDIQVTPGTNTEGIRKALQKSRSPKYEVRVLPGLNHLFQNCTLCTISEYGMLDETFSETALSEITGWLQKNVLQ
jgi:pimeloyl-ACP methyl ester carboxylesterase